jgi:hypothetical protein
MEEDFLKYKQTKNSILLQGREAESQVTREVWEGVLQKVCWGCSSALDE